MVRLKIECTGMLIDNFATQNDSIELKISLENCDGRLALKSYPSKPRSKHEFLIFDGTDIGFSGKYNLTQEQSSEIFLLACTLLEPRKYLSFYQPDRLAGTMVFDTPTNRAQQINDITCSQGQIFANINIACHGSVSVSTHLTSQFVIDGNRLFWIIDRLLHYRIFDTTYRTISELNVIDAIKLYRDSLSAIDARSSYLSMYAAFEKIVNATEERKGNDFDNFATYFSGMEQTNITHLRELENRLKHPLRNNTSDVIILKKFEENSRLELKQLKTATDPAILSAICKHYFY